MKAVFTISILLLSYASIGQPGYSFGARHAGLAGASLTLTDAFSLFNNVGALGKIEQDFAIAGYQNRFGLAELQTIAAGFNYRTNFGTAGVGFYKFGDDNFSQQKIHLAFSNQIQIVSLGLGIDVIQYQIAEVGTKQSLAVQFGGVAELTPKLLFAGHIFNITQTILDEETRERIPTIMKGGMSFRPTDELILNIEVEKQLSFKEIVKIGLEYQVVEQVFARTGIRTNPIVGAFGVGFHPKRLRFDYAYSNDANLGSIHDIALSYLLKK